MKQNNNILEELKELQSSLANFAVAQPYVVPDGYFETLSSIVLAKIKAIESADASEELKLLSPLLSTVSKQMPYEVPAGYFENIEPSVFSTASSVDEELKNISPLLSGLKKETPYSVPPGYFDALETVSSKQPVHATTKIVSITKRNIFRYAAAAVMIGVIATIGLIFLTRSPMERFEAKLNKEIKKTSDKELKEFIQYNTQEGQDVALNVPKDEVKDLLKDVPAIELQNFLDEIADPEIVAEDDLLME